MSIRLLPDGTIEFGSPADLVAYQEAQGEPRTNGAPKSTGPEDGIHWVTRSESLAMDVLREANGEALTASEVADLLGWTPNKASRHLNALIANGFGRPSLVEIAKSIRHYRTTPLGKTAELIVFGKPALKYAAR